MCANLIFPLERPAATEYPNAADALSGEIKDVSRAKITQLCFFGSSAGALAVPVYTSRVLRLGPSERWEVVDWRAASERLSGLLACVRGTARNPEWVQAVLRSSAGRVLLLAKR